MTIKISGNSKISDIQKEFNKEFPFLKLEFFSKQPGKQIGSEKFCQVDSAKKICENPKAQKEGDFFINSRQTVAELEKAFKEYFGLSVQVFRKSGKMWLQSTITDDWTLKEQNEHGEALSNFTPVKQGRKI